MAAYFSRTVYLRNLKRFWPLSVLILITAFFTFIVPELGMRSFRGYESFTVGSGARVVDIMPQLIVYCTVFVPTFSIFTAIAVFGYLHKPKAAGFISSLPISRLWLYITNWLSGLTIMLVPAFLIGLLYGALLIGVPVASGHFLIWLGMMIFAHLIFFSIAVFATFLTGKLLMQIFLYGLMNSIVLILFGITTFVADRLVYGYDGGLDSTVAELAMFFTPPVAIVSLIGTFSNMGMPDEFLSIVPWVIYPLLTAGMVFFGYKLYKNRRIESAGNVIVNKTLQVIFKYLVGVMLGAMLGFSLTEILSAGNRFTMNDYTICFTVSVAGFGALGCLFTEMLIRKKLRVWKTAYKSMLIFVAAVVAIVLFIRFDVIGYERRVPDSNKVVAVSFSGSWSNNNTVLFNDEKDLMPFQVRSGYGWRLKDDYVTRQTRFDLPLITPEIRSEIKLRSPEYFESAEAIAAASQLHHALVQDKRYLERSPNDFYYGSGARFTLMYKMADGSVISRQYMMSVSETPLLDSAQELYALYAMQEAVEKRCRFLNLSDNAVTTITADILNQSRGSYTLRDGRVAQSDMPKLLAAMRQDVAAGNLGIIEVDTSVGVFLWSGKVDSQKDVYKLNLVYDHSAAGVPYELEARCLECGSSTCSDSGLVQMLTVTENSINTVRVLNSLTFLTDSES